MENALINAGNCLVAVGGRIKDFSVSAGGALVSGAKKVGSAVVAGAKVAGSAIATGAKKVGSAAVAGAKVAGSAIAKGAKVAGSAIATGAKKVGNGLKVAGKATIEKFKNAVVVIKNSQIYDNFKEVTKRALVQIENVAKEAVEVAKNIGNKCAQSVKNAAIAIRNKAAKFVSGGTRGYGALMDANGNVTGSVQVEYLGGEEIRGIGQRLTQMGRSIRQGLIEFKEKHKGSLENFKERISNSTRAIRERVSGAATAISIAARGMIDRGREYMEERRAAKEEDRNLRNSVNRRINRRTEREIDDDVEDRTEYLDANIFYLLEGTNKFFDARTREMIDPNKITTRLASTGKFEYEIEGYDLGFEIKKRKDGTYINPQNNQLIHPITCRDYYFDKDKSPRDLDTGRSIIDMETGEIAGGTPNRVENPTNITNENLANAQYSANLGGELIYAREESQVESDSTENKPKQNFYRFAVPQIEDNADDDWEEERLSKADFSLVYDAEKGVYIDKKSGRELYPFVINRYSKSEGIALLDVEGRKVYEDAFLGSTYIIKMLEDGEPYPAINENGEVVALFRDKKDNKEENYEDENDQTESEPKVKEAYYYIVDKRECVAFAFDAETRTPIDQEKIHMLQLKMPGTVPFVGEIEGYDKITELRKNKNGFYCDPENGYPIHPVTLQDFYYDDETGIATDLKTNQPIDLKTGLPVKIVPTNDKETLQDQENLIREYADIYSDYDVNRQQLEDIANCNDKNSQVINNIVGNHFIVNNQTTEVRPQVNLSEVINFIQSICSDLDKEEISDIANNVIKLNDGIEVGDRSIKKSTDNIENDDAAEFVMDGLIEIPPELMNYYKQNGRIPFEKLMRPSKASSANKPKIEFDNLVIS